MYSGFSDLCNTCQKALSIKRKAEIKIRAFGFLWSGYRAFLTNLYCLCSHANCPQIGLIAFRLGSSHCPLHQPWNAVDRVHLFTNQKLAVNCSNDQQTKFWRHNMQADLPWVLHAWKTLEVEWWFIFCNTCYTCSVTWFDALPSFFSRRSPCVLGLS